MGDFFFEFRIDDVRESESKSIQGMNNVNIVGWIDIMDVPGGGCYNNQFVNIKKAIVFRWRTEHHHRHEATKAMSHTLSHSKMW